MWEASAGAPRVSSATRTLLNVKPRRPGKLLHPSHPEFTDPPAPSDSRATPMKGPRRITLKIDSMAELCQPLGRKTDKPLIRKPCGFADTNSINAPPTKINSSMASNLSPETLHTQPPDDSSAHTLFRNRASASKTTAAFPAYRATVTRLDKNIAKLQLLTHQLFSPIPTFRPPTTRTPQMRPFG